MFLIASFARTAELGPVGHPVLGNRPDELLSPVMTFALWTLVVDALLISVFSVGLKLDLLLSNRQWLLPLRLAIASKTLTVALIATAGTWCSVSHPARPSSWALCGK